MSRAGLLRLVAVLVVAPQHVRPARDADLPAAALGSLEPDVVEQVQRQVGGLLQLLRYRGPWRTGWRLALLGTLPDEKLARKLGRSRTAVTQKRIDLGIPLTCDRRHRESRK